jgi:isoquinoline 1-oxidoreductase alpha subunit
MQISFTVNGAQRSVDVDGEKPLLWVLREDLNLPGTKFGCGAGLCGACTVHVNGAAIRACQTMASDIMGKKVTTIEGVAEAAPGRRVRDAWIALDVPQCGYCQAGQIMSAVALLTETPRPDDAAIDTAMAGNLCRCATYVRIRAAIRKAAA